MVPGGSATLVASAASKAIRGVDSNLYICLTDERPGPVDHPESNWKQLKETGFNYLSREYFEILNGQNADVETTAYSAWLNHFVSVVDFKIGLFGIGTDGHTAGILPGCNTPSGALAAYYKDGTRERISVTPQLIAKLDVAVVYAMGIEKKPMLELLASGQPSDLPLICLQAAGELIVYNDQIEL